MSGYLDAAPAREEGGRGRSVTAGRGMFKGADRLAMEAEAIVPRVRVATNVASNAGVKHIDTLPA